MLWASQVRHHSLWVIASTGRELAYCAGRWGSRIMLNSTAAISPALSEQCAAANHFSRRQRHQSKKNGSALKPWLDICWDKALIVMRLSRPPPPRRAFIPLLILYTLPPLHCRPLGPRHYEATVIWSTPTFNQLDSPVGRKRLRGDQTCLGDAANMTYQNINIMRMLQERVFTEIALHSVFNKPLQFCESLFDLL